MADWIDRYLKLAIASHRRHLMIADPDGLLAYPELREAIEAEGFQIMILKNALEVRLALELRVRYSADKFLVSVPTRYSPLPDIGAVVHCLTVGLRQLFPNYDAAAIKGLSSTELSMLPSIAVVLSREDTLLFLFQALYDLDFRSLASRRSTERALAFLITLYFERKNVSQTLLAEANKFLRPWLAALKLDVISRDAIVRLLQVEWEHYATIGSSTVDFEEPDLANGLRLLFAMEYLRPVKVSETRWDGVPKVLQAGIYFDVKEANEVELDSLLSFLTDTLATLQDSPEQWFQLIVVLAKAKIKLLSANSGRLQHDFTVLEAFANLRFQEFLRSSYQGLFSMSGVRKPVVVSRILDNIRASQVKKKALLVVDGMNYWQWLLLSKELAVHGVASSNGACLAYIPTITAWSRQSIFRGDRPDLDENNAKEEQLFRGFWRRNGYPSYQIDFKKFGIASPLVTESIAQDVTVLGLVCNDLDDIMHGSILGDDQLKSSTEQWIEKSKVVETVTKLREMGFALFLTADHGNVEARGMRNLKLKDKVGALSRSKRHLRFTNEILLQSFLAENDTSIMATKDLSVYLMYKEAFAQANETVITHGGSHFWEVIVPYICIDGK